MVSISINSYQYLEKMGACLCCEPRPSESDTYEPVTTEVPNKDYNKERQKAIKTLDLSFI